MRLEIADTINISDDIYRRFLLNHNAIYTSIIERARSRQPDDDEYYEKHHIIPKCLGGTDDDTNIVKLTAREHYLSHQLLIHMYPYNTKIILAAMMMCVDSEYRGTRSDNRLYEWIRKKFSDDHPSKTDGGKEKIRNGLEKYYSSLSWERKKEKIYNESREKRLCECGCGEAFIVSKKSSKRYLNIKHSRIGKVTSENVRKKQSTSLKKYIHSLSKDESLERMERSFRSCDHLKRCKNISLNKKNKKTNQQEIMGRRYASMTDSDFEMFLENKTKGVKIRSHKLRSKWKNLLIDL